VKYGEFGAALVGIAGPLTNLVLAVLAGLWARYLFGIETMVGEVLVLFMFVNLAFFVFNMIPWPPLDGSRVLYAFAPEPLQNFMRQIEGFGLMGIALFIFTIYTFIAPIIGRLIFAISEIILGQPLGL
jgi:Zn-dependent protease